MVASGEGALTEVTLEWSITGMFAVVTCKLIRSCKLPATSLPRAAIRFLASVRSEVSLQMRTFGVGFGTTRVRTSVGCLAFAAPGASSTFLWLDQSWVHDALWQEKVNKLLWR